MSSVSGPSDEPSPNTSRVTPWRMSLSPAPSSIRLSLVELRMLINPGVTVSLIAAGVLYSLWKTGGQPEPDWPER